ncbi:MAG TPA: hypothetical protein VHB20_02605 [Verrucomicrobiae bacterium]|nr:hypothetical protein [Verrucomicrobiae bacterium]
MNIGLGNLTELKGQLLAASLRSDTNYDNVIAAIGQGVAAQFDHYCNRKLARLQNDTDQFRADRRHYYLPRYPVESISQCQRQDTLTQGWATLAVTDLIQQWNLHIGYIAFGATQGDEFSQLLVTYTGGFWFDTSEDGSQTLPVGASPLPADLKFAWYLQCQNVWRQWDKLGNQIAEAPEGQTAGQTLQLAPAVKELLDEHRRLFAS